METADPAFLTEMRAMLVLCLCCVVVLCLCCASAVFVMSLCCAGAVIVLLVRRACTVRALCALFTRCALERRGALIVPSIRMYSYLIFSIRLRETC